MFAPVDVAGLAGALIACKNRQEAERMAISNAVIRAEHIRAESKPTTAAVACRYCGGWALDGKMRCCGCGAPAEKVVKGQDRDAARLRALALGQRAMVQAEFGGHGGSGHAVDAAGYYLYGSQFANSQWLMGVKCE